MITVKPYREEALKAGFRALEGRLTNISFDAFTKALASWDVRAFCKEDEVVGMLMVKDAELHVAVIPEVRGKWLSRRLIREVIGPLIDKHGEAVTSVMPGNEVGKDFVSRIGFEANRVKILREGFRRGTFDPTTALVLGGAQLAGGLISSDAASKAGSQQTAAANRATDTNLQMFNTVNSQAAPYRQAGSSALSAIGEGLGLPGYGTSTGAINYNGQAFDSLGTLKNSLVDDYVRQGGDPSTQQYQTSLQDVLNKATPADGNSGPNSGYFTHQFGANDLNANLAPNYAFTLAQGQGAAANALNLTGGLGGNFGKGLVDYTTAKAGDAYQNAFNNYTTNQSNIFNRLSTIAGLGSSSNQTTANAGTSLGGNIGNAQMAAGAGQASGTVGSANALTGGVSNAASWYALPQILKAGNAGAGLNV